MSFAWAVRAPGLRLFGQRRLRQKRGGGAGKGDRSGEEGCTGKGDYVRRKAVQAAEIAPEKKVVRAKEISPEKEALQAEAIKKEEKVVRTREVALGRRSCGGPHSLRQCRLVPASICPPWTTHLGTVSAGK